MPTPRLIKLAQSWKPDPKDPYGADKLRLIQYLLKSKASSDAPVTLTTLLKNVPFTTVSRREAFQHNLLGPLRRDRRVFVGTSNRGVFLVTTAEDVDATLGFYTWRVRAELRHARNLKALAKRTRVLNGYTPKATEKDRAIIYFDESGTPDIADTQPPVFVVAAVIVDSKQELSTIEHRFRSASALIKRDPEKELRTKGMSVAHHAKALRELSMLDFQWVAACFVKDELDSEGFKYPKTFYRYAFQFLVGDLLTLAWQADLVIDENSTPAFQAALASHLRRQNSGLPINRLGDINFAASSKTRLVQLADLIAGAVRRSVGGEEHPLREIEHKMIDLQFWPPEGDDAFRARPTLSDTLTRRLPTGPTSALDGPSKDSLGARRKVDTRSRVSRSRHHQESPDSGPLSQAPQITTDDWVFVETGQYCRGRGEAHPTERVRRY